jgi:hypothetical protein
MRRTTGRLKNDYQYATSVVYNNFVWPSCGEAAKVDVRDCARAVLEARMPYQEQGATLADMYDPDNEAYFPKLISAHRRLDAAVEEAYGVDFKGDEDRIVAHLFELYAERTRGEM